VSKGRLLDAVALTLDVDWAPDFVIDHVARILVTTGARATWFVTHESPAIDRLRERPDLFELGIHPNFLPGSSHGASVEAVLEHCLSLVPTARSMRTHSLVQSTPLLVEVLRRTPIEVDVSLLLLHHRSLQPVEFRWEGRCLLRLPFRWEDDMEMERRSPSWAARDLLDGGGGLNILNFHPVHVYLNSSDPKPYRAAKAEAPDLIRAVPGQFHGLISPGEGAGTALAAVARHLGQEGGGSRMVDVRDRWRAEANTDAA
jgi:hypothetical protein